MKIGEESVGYYPNFIKTIEQIELKDIKSGVLYLPEDAEKIDDKAVPFYLRPKKIIIPNSNYTLNNKIIKKSNSVFILEKGEEINGLFSDIKAKEVILSSDLKHISRPGFYNSKIGVLEIPSTAILGEGIFKKASIKHLILNQKCLSKVEAKWVLKNGLTLTIKDKNKTLFLKPISVFELQQFHMCKYALNHYKILAEKNDPQMYKLICAEYLKILKEMEYYLYFHDHIYLYNLLKKDLESICDYHIETDGYSVKDHDKKIKVLTLEDVLRNRNKL